MKTKSKYYTVSSLIIICILVLFYKYNLQNKEINYVSENINENKLVKSEIKKEVEKSELNILFVGDIMTDRYIRKQINKYENNSELKIGENFVNKYLNNLSEINSKYDYVVANLEGPITENKSKSLNDDGSYGTDLIFTFPTSTTQILRLLNIKVVSLANNHTDNFYHKGYEDTKRFLEKEDINYFGNPYNDEKEKLSKKVCEKNICVTYIGYNQFTQNNSKEIISEEIKRIKNINLKSQKEFTDFIVIMPHWGTEYEKLSNNMQREYAREWIDAGADAVLGAHPHVIQENKIYKSKYIYYSLGNYIFDQWFTEDVQNGLGLDLIFKKECEVNKENKKNNYKNITEDINKNEREICKKEIILNKELKVFIDRNGVKYML